MYNQELKEKYLLKINENQKRACERTLESISKVEVKLNKNIYDFTIDEYTEAFKELNVKSMEVFKTKFSIVKSYVNFCIEQGYSIHGINFLIGFETSRWFALIK
jgi:hypothetical protein